MSHSEAKPLVVVTVSWRVAPVRAQPVGDLLQPLQQLGGGALQDAALLGQHQRAMPALEQGNAQVLLQRPDLPADGRLGDEQLLGRLGEGEVACRRLEALDQVQRGEIEASLLHYASSCMK